MARVLEPGTRPYRAVFHQRRCGPSYDTVARHIGEAAGRPIVHRRLSTDELAARWRANGMNAESAQVMGLMDTMVAGGGEDRTTDCVEALTGRSPTDFRTFAQANGAVWAPAHAAS
jgi:hypothetical protein